MRENVLRNATRPTIRNYLAPRGSPVEVEKTCSKPFAHLSFTKIIRALLIWRLNFSTVH